MLSLEKLTIAITARNILLQDSEIQRLVGGKIFPSVAPTNTPSPHITYERDAYEVESVKMGAIREVARLTYVITSDDYDIGLEIAVAMHRVLQGNHGDETFEIIDSAERYSEGKYLQIIDFKIT